MYKVKCVWVNENYKYRKSGVREEMVVSSFGTRWKVAYRGSMVGALSQMSFKR